MSKQNYNKKKWTQIAQKAMSDEKFKNELLKNPKKVFSEEGIEIPANINLHIHENTKNDIHIVLPKHTGTSMSDKELENVAAAGYPCCYH